MTNARFCLGEPAVLEILSEKSCRVVACTHIAVGKDASRHFEFTYKYLTLRKLLICPCSLSCALIDHKGNALIDTLLVLIFVHM